MTIKKGVGIREDYCFLVFAHAFIDFDGWLVPPLDALDKVREPVIMIADCLNACLVDILSMSSRKSMVVLYILLACPSPVYFLCPMLELLGCAWECWPSSSG